MGTQQTSGPKQFIPIRGRVGPTGAGQEDGAGFYAPHLTKVDVWAWMELIHCVFVRELRVTSREETIFRAVRGGQAQREKKKIREKRGAEIQRSSVR